MIRPHDVDVQKEEHDMTRPANGTPGRGVQGRPDVATPPVHGEARVRQILTTRRGEILALFANERNPEAMYARAEALTIGAFRKLQDDAAESARFQNKPPQAIDEPSAVACCLWAMQRKLDPGTDVYLVPYGGKVTPIMSPEGVIKLLFRTGLVKAINARYVFDGELFDYELGTAQYVKHKKANKRPLASKDKYGKVGENIEEWEALAHTYAIIELKDGGQTIEVLDKADIAYYRSLSPTGDSKYGGWAKFPAAFGRKAALKQAAKFVPKESEISMILLGDDSERGVEIPEEIMNAVNARTMNEMADMGGAGQEGGANASPTTQSAGQTAAPPTPGNPEQIALPGRAPQPKISDATNDALTKAETWLRGNFDEGKIPPNWYAQSVTQLATMRAEMRTRGLPVPPHAALDAAIQAQPVEPAEDFGYGAGAMRQPGEEG